MPAGLQDTIFSLSSGRLPAGVAVVRLSGPRAIPALIALAGATPPARELRLRSIRSPDGALIDRALVAVFPRPATFTGEDCAELHLHGGSAVVRAITAALTGMEGTRQAEPGEFTRRAFANGRLDLVEAEALSDLIAAETEAQRRFAVQNSIASNALYADWRSRILRARARIEADLDFSDQEDVPTAFEGVILNDLAALAGEIDAHADGFTVSEIIKDGFRVAVMGRPNAGKSSLINYLARRDAAIVTDEPGTTRDIIEVTLDLHGMKIVVADTAGLRATDNVVERVGVEKALAYGRAADMVVHLVDPTAPGADTETVAIPSDAARTLISSSKADLGRSVPCAALSISCVTGSGIDALLENIRQRVESTLATAGSALPFRQRHVALLREAAEALREGLASGSHPEVLAENIRIAGDAIGRITGHIDVEEVLGEIFSRFCIGK